MLRLIEKFLGNGSLMLADTIRNLTINQSGVKIDFLNERGNDMKRAKR